MEDGVDGGILLHSEAEGCVRFIEFPAPQDYCGSGVYLSHVASAGLAVVSGLHPPIQAFCFNTFQP